MTRPWRTALAVAVMLAAPVAVSGQVGAPDRGIGEPLAPTPMDASPWTDNLGCVSGQQLSLRATLSTIADSSPYWLYLYLENVETGTRTYYGLDPLTGTIVALPGSHPTDAYGYPAGERDALPRPIDPLSRQRLRLGPAPPPGPWHFVIEVCAPSDPQVMKRAGAKFVVSRRPPVELGADGQDTGTSADTVRANDTVRKVYGEVFVNPGATLTIEPGALTQAKGPNAVIVVEIGTRIVAAGRRAAPILMTCDAPVGQRGSGCWAGLIVLGDAPMTRGTGLADGVIPETRPAYGGDSPAGSTKTGARPTETAFGLASGQRSRLATCSFPASARTRWSSGPIRPPSSRTERAASGTRSSPRTAGGRASSSSALER